MSFTQPRRVRRRRALGAVFAGLAMAAASSGTAFADDAPSFTTVSTPSVAAGSTFTAITALDDANAWAVGSTPTSGNPYASSEPLIEHWDGSSWQLMATPDIQGGALTSVSALAANDVWAVGYQTYPPPPPGQTQYFGNPVVLLHWDGSTWTQVHWPMPPAKYVDQTLRSVLAISPDDVWAVGNQYDQGTESPLILHWNGLTWSGTVTRNGPLYPANLLAVTATASDDVWATGWGSDANGNATMLVEHWDGDSWSQQPAPDGSLSIGEAATTDSWGDVILGGGSGQPPNWQSQYGGAPPSMVGSFDGDQWTNSTLSGDLVHSLCSDGSGGLWAATQLASNAGPSLLHWDGTSWTRANLPSGLPANVAWGNVAVAASASGATTWAIVDANILRAN